MKKNNKMFKEDLKIKLNNKYFFLTEPDDAFVTTEKEENKDDVEEWEKKSDMSEGKALDILIGYKWIFVEYRKWRKRSWRFINKTKKFISYSDKIEIFLRYSNYGH